MAYIGNVAQLLLGNGGLSGSKNQAAIDPDQLIIADNITYERGTISKEGGASKYNSTALSGTPKIIGGFDWFPSGTTQRLIVLGDDGKLYKDTGGGDFTVTLKSGLTVSDIVPIFVEGGKEAAANDRKLFVFTQKNVVQVLAADGATTSDITTPPADWSGSNQPRFGLAHEGRVWGGGNANDPHRMYYSDTSDHENFTGGVSGSISVFPGEGRYLVAAVSFKGLIIAFKYPKGVYAIDTSSATIANWRVTKLSDKVGGASEQCAVVIDNDILFMDSGGIFRVLSGVQQFGDMSTSDLSKSANFSDFMRDEVNFSQLTQVRGVYYPAKKEAHFGIAGTGATTNSRRVVVDFNGTDLPRFRFSTRDTPVSVFLRQDSDGVQRLTIGDDGGFVWNLDQDNRSRDSSGYQGLFQTTHVDMSFLDPNLGIVNKNFNFLELVVQPSGNHNLNVDVFLDDALSQTITFNLGEAGSTLGTFVLGTDKLAGTKLINKKKRMVGSGKRISIAGRNNGDGQDFSVSKFFVHFTPGEDRDLG